MSEPDTSLAAVKTQAMPPSITAYFSQQSAAFLKRISPFSVLGITYSKHISLLLLCHAACKHLSYILVLPSPFPYFFVSSSFLSVSCNHRPTVKLVQRGLLSSKTVWYLNLFLSLVAVYLPTRFH
jgi:hypothetical protein